MFFAFWMNSLRNCCLCERDDLSQRDSTPLSSASERTGAMPRLDLSRKKCHRGNGELPNSALKQMIRRGPGPRIQIQNPSPSAGFPWA